MDVTIFVVIPSFALADALDDGPADPAKADFDLAVARFTARLLKHSNSATAYLGRGTALVANRAGLPCPKLILQG